MTLSRHPSRSCTRSRRGPTAAPAAAARPARRGPRARARRQAAPCEPPATPALFRSSLDLLRVDLVLLGTARRPAPLGVPPAEGLHSAPIGALYANRRSQTGALSPPVCVRRDRAPAL